MRQYLPSFADLIDRLAIDQLKEVFIPDNKQYYREEMSRICHDIALLIEQENIKLTTRMLRSIVVLAQINTHIWYNESEARKGETQDLEKLKLTHGINGIRNYAKNVILHELGATVGYDYKTDSLAADFKDWQIDLGEMDGKQRKD